ncbi:MAG TPA: GNA1162 family protein [Syntrophales bacterium]|nr:GNA1162 family protein [Syntrophales bacterium]
MTTELRSSILIILALLLTVLFQGCVVATKETAVSPQVRDLHEIFKGTYKIDPYMEKHKPQTIAILPFVNVAKSQKGSEEVRKAFYNHMSSLPYKSMKLYTVDNTLRKAGLDDPAVIDKMSPKELGKILGVDAVLYGSISDFDKLFAVVYSQVAVGAEIKMYDTKTGNFLWSGQHVTRIHEGGISTTPIGIIATVIATSMNMRDIQLLRACDDLFRDMVKTIPVPTIAEALRPPTITLLTQDTKNQPKKAGDEIKVVIQGTPKMQAYFDIGEFKRRIDMQEVEPGGYLGVYKVIPGDNVAKAVITAYLRDEAGNTAQWVDAVGTVTLDTIPPDKVKKVKAVGRNNVVLLSWEKSPATDLAGYRVYRSNTPLSGFREVAKTELAEHRDENLVNSQKYYYQVTAVDWAGNESENSDTMTGMPVSPGPTPVSGVIETDTVWYAGASPYVISGAVVVRDKATLTIEPGTEIRSRGNALVVEGRLAAQGDEEHIILFDAAEGGKPWDGIAFSNVKDRENSIKFCRIRGAATGITCQASSPQIEASEFLENDIAIKIIGAFSKPQITKNTIHKNRQTGVMITDGAQPNLSDNNIQDNVKDGILIQSAVPSIVHNRITRNEGNGILVKNAQPVISENNITDNKLFDIAGDMTGEAVNALNNWWGSVKGLDVLARIHGKINIKSILNAAYPEGKPQELPILGQVLGGPIKTDAFLILSNSPYRVAKDVVVDSGATLYIEPGVTVEFDQKTSIITEDGGVVAKGTKRYPIVFTASGSSPSPGFYNNAVRFMKPTKVNSSFAYCIVKFANTAFDIYYGAPEISSCSISQNAQGGIYTRNDASPRIFYNTFSGNMGEGAIKCVGMSNPVIHNNNFIDNTVAIQTFSSIYIDARNNWWGTRKPDQNMIWGDFDKNINIKPWLAAPESGAFAEIK